jgi:N-acetyl-alpha-D-muramate 1-phosphate uridylyltransferase
MKAMLLAAGRGARMGALTEHVPKPLLKVGPHALIEWHLFRLAQAGFKEVVINHAYLGHLIEQAVGDGRRYGVKVAYSIEKEALETAGGIRKALHLLMGEKGEGASDSFAVISSDIFTNFPLERLFTAKSMIDHFNLNGYCITVPNPPHHLAGDFACETGMLRPASTQARTYAGIGVFRARMFDSISLGSSEKLVTLFKRDSAANQLGAEVFHGLWEDVGTPERLDEMNRRTVLPFRNHM